VAAEESSSMQVQLSSTPWVTPVVEAAARFTPEATSKVVSARV